jgi:lipopolysaccharide export system permease protein
MQFMFRYVDDFVGKGMGALVLLEFLFYAALSVIPLALPLSILLGSLMTFGNLGEKLELLAMKAAGISLFKIMKSLIILIAFVSIGSFYFANNILPITQVRMWGLLFSIQEASPELEIPQGAFYGGITGRNVYAETKRDGLLLDVVIYDYSRGFNNTGIILADTGRLRLTEDKKQLVLELYNGECFENLQDADNSNNYSNNKIIPYRRETFARKELVIDFDANFKELSNSYLEDQYVAKNVDQLNETVDSIKVKIVDHAKLEKERKQKNTYFNRSNTSAEELTVFREPDLNLEEKQTLQAHFARLININKTIILKAAQKNATQVTSRQDSYDSLIQWFHNEMRRHEIEKYKRYTLAFACFIFLFIGAPLGAIIRKGGMGMPVVLSTVLFIIYYIIDNTGYKMAREGVWEVWQGMWLSAFILLPFGILLTYMAATESSIMNGESYIMVFKKFFSKENVIFAKIKKLKQNK